MFHIKGVDFNEILSLWACCWHLICTTSWPWENHWFQFDLHICYGVYLTHTNQNWFYVCRFNEETNAEFYCNMICKFGDVCLICRQMHFVQRTHRKVIWMLCIWTLLLNNLPQLLANQSGMSYSLLIYMHCLPFHSSFVSLCQNLISDQLLPLMSPLLSINLVWQILEWCSIIVSWIYEQCVLFHLPLQIQLCHVFWKQNIWIFQISFHLTFIARFWETCSFII